MPELRFSITWPDGTAETCYSPSTVIREHFTQDTAYTLAEFLARARSALAAASDRVQARYGMPCSLALGQLASIETTASCYDAASIIHFQSFKE